VFLVAFPLSLVQCSVREQAYSASLAFAVDHFSFVNDVFWLGGTGLVVVAVVVAIRRHSIAATGIVAVAVAAAAIVVGLRLRCLRV